MKFVKHQRPDIDKIYWYVKDTLKSKHQLLINRRKTSSSSKFIKYRGVDYSQKIDDIYKNLEDYNPIKKRKVLTVFDYIIADMESNKK